MRFTILVFLITRAFGAIGQPDTLSITLENVPYPYPVRYLSIEVGCEDLRMAFMDVTPEKKANGKVVMLLHGKNFGGYYWARVIAGLAESGYRVIVPDQIGFGRSSKPLIQYSFHLLSTQNRKLLDSLNIERVILVGHSMGGMLAARFALMYPHRVEKLVLENPIGLEDYRSFVPYSTLEEQYRKELQSTAAAIRRYYQTSYFPTWKPEYEYLVRVAAGVIHSAEFPRYARVAALTYQMIYEQPVVHEFGSLKVPCVLIIGIRDSTIVGKDKLSEELRQRYGNYAVLGKQTVENIPDGKLIELSAGHIPHLEIPDQFLAGLLRSFQESH